jgi:hypothetical protein
VAQGKEEGQESMNIILSSALLALAIMMVALQLKEMVDNSRYTKKLEELVVASGVKKRRVSRPHAPADWERILRETELKKAGRRK